MSLTTIVEMPTWQMILTCGLCTAAGAGMATLYVYKVAQEAIRKKIAELPVITVHDEKNKTFGTPEPELPAPDGDNTSFAHAHEVLKSLQYIRSQLLARRAQLRGDATPGPEGTRWYRSLASLVQHMREVEISIDGLRTEIAELERGISGEYAEEVERIADKFGINNEWTRPPRPGAL